MDWTFWLLSGVAVFAITLIVWGALDAMGLLGEHWDDNYPFYEDEVE
jgi:uncharacterized membrane protein